MELDLAFARSHFPAFARPELAGWSFFENAGGSYACAHTIDALHHYYVATKVQPYGPYPASAAAGDAMDASHRRWAEALGVAEGEVMFGPSTTANTYVLANALAPMLGPGPRVVVTNQDHEANTGSIRRVAEAAGSEVVEWSIDPATGLLDLERLAPLLTDEVTVMTMPHCSNIVGMENDVAAVAAMVHEVGARLIVDGVSFAPHGLPDVAALDADVYLFSLYKVYSVHQGLMVVRNGLLDEVTNQGHFFNQSIPTKRLTPAGPDHAQEAAAGAVLDYVLDSHRHHGGSGADDLATAARATSALWQQHEQRLLAPLLDTLGALDGVRVLGPPSAEGSDPSGRLHRCPTVAFVPRHREPTEVAEALVEHRVMAGAGDFYAARVLAGLDVPAERGVVRLSFVHYTDEDDIARAQQALVEILG
ncbi:MAG: aminotransferase class V-fold PLP-dependent enzyme [Actinomycetota bacterium]